jgi:hypothetical protein
MCDFNKGFILCSCKIKEKKIVHNKNSRQNKKMQGDAPQIYRWILSEFKETQTEWLAIGRYKMPISDIGQGLTEEWVLLNLNERNCFDFNYIPKEGDDLVIRSNISSSYLSFIFQNGQWESGLHDPFSTISKLKMDGEIKEIEEDESIST